MSDAAPAYGLWLLVLVNSAVFILFAFSFAKPATKRDWRSFGAFSAFIVALFTEMYGFPLTIYILTGILGSKYPVLNPFSHASGHLWLVLFGGGPTMMAVIHLISNGLVIIGFAIMWKGWKLIHGAKDQLVTSGPYAYVRHPQYSGLFLVMIGMLIQWPTIITALMFPVLIYVYYRLSKREENEMLILFGDEYRRYLENTPMFLPGVRAKRHVLPTIIIALTTALMLNGCLMWMHGMEHDADMPKQQPAKTAVKEFAEKDVTLSLDVPPLAVGQEAALVAQVSRVQREATIPGAQVTFVIEREAQPGEGRAGRLFTIIAEREAGEIAEKGAHQLRYTFEEPGLYRITARVWTGEKARAEPLAISIIQDAQRQEGHKAEGSTTPLVIIGGVVMAVMMILMVL